MRIAEVGSVGLRPTVRAFLILLAVAAAVGLGLLLVRDLHTLRVRSAHAAEDPRFPAYLAALVGADLTRGNHYEVLTDGEEFFPAMLEAIENARRRVSFETYFFEKGEVAERFTTAFERAAQRGAAVTIVLDAVGASFMPREYIERLENAGCRVLHFNPPRWYSLDRVNYRTHRKILVVDGEIGFTGGAGVGDHWIDTTEDGAGWRETHVRMRGPIVRLLEGSFYENVFETDGPVTPELAEAPLLLDGNDGASLLVRSSPTGASNDLKRLYLLILAAAQRSADIATPYFVTDPSIMWSLEDAVARGVSVRILVEGDITDAMPVKYASRAKYERLMEMGIEIYEYQPTMMHAKVLVVDRIVSMFGSANFDNRSLELNDELNVAVWSGDLAERFTKDFEEDLRSATKLELHSWRQRSWLDKGREQFWRIFGELF